MNDHVGGSLLQTTPSEDYHSSPIPLPSTSSASQTSLAVILSDNKAICALIDQILHKSGITQAEVCRRLGISPSNFNQYRLGRRMRPSLWWIARLVDVCNCKLFIEFPSRPLR